MTIAKKVSESLTRSSMIRKMFEEGAQLKAKYGAENVFDFSLGNPNVVPPEAFFQALGEVAKESQPSDHGYMPQAGNPVVRDAAADFFSRQQGVSLSADEIFMTAGAAGGLNVILKTILDPGDEVLSPSPCFVEYGFYADNYGGIFKTVRTKTDFTLDLNAMEEAITKKTKALIINSPHNPTGQVYSRESLEDLSRLLKEKNEEYGKTIYLLADEPYRTIVYGDVEVPGILAIYPESIIVTSHSKDLSIPGERVGYAVINPNMKYKHELIDGMVLTSRISGHINAPAFIQRVAGRLQGITVDVSEYQHKLDLIAGGLREIGYDFIEPKGAFYLFPKSPIPDDKEFVAALKEERILAVPGSGFMGPGYFRLAFCVDDATITNSLPGFKKVMDRYR